MKRRKNLERSKFKREGYQFNGLTGVSLGKGGRIKVMGTRSTAWFNFRKEYLSKLPNMVVCHYCALQGIGLLRPKHSMTLDHKNGRAGALLLDENNIVIACFRCNQDKGSIGYDKYVATLDFKS
jgi:5-methylcytosine-specific restriction endonuclease McrA